MRIQKYIYIAFFVLNFFTVSPSYAQINSNPQGSFDVQIGGRVSSQSASQQITGSTIPVNISGFASPNASIVIVDSDGNSITSFTADKNGSFTVTKVSLPAGSGEYCFKVVDFKRLGTSESCMTINPSTNTNITNIYLPPTIGVERAEISEGEDAVIYGYTMPNATVKLRLSTGELVAITADETGYYEYRNDALESGEYSFVASASYNATDSLDPKNSAKITKLSAEEIAKKAKETLKKAGKGGFPWWILLLILLTGLIGALILIAKKNPALFHKITPFVIPILHKIAPNKGLHHDKIMKQIQKESAV